MLQHDLLRSICWASSRLRGTNLDSRVLLHILLTLAYHAIVFCACLSICLAVIAYYAASIFQSSWFIPCFDQWLVT